MSRKMGLRSMKTEARTFVPLLWCQKLVVVNTINGRYGSKLRNVVLGSNVYSVKIPTYAYHGFLLLLYWRISITDKKPYGIYI